MTDREKLEAVIAEIERQINELHPAKEKIGIVGGAAVRRHLESILSFIDSMQEKTVVQCVPFEPVGVPVDKVVSANIPDKKEEPVSEDLEKAARSYSNNIDNICGGIGEQTRNAFKAGAQWGRNQAMTEIQAQSMTLAHGCPKEESVSDDLEEAAWQYVKEHVIGIDKITFSIAIDMFISGAEWQKSNLWKPSDGDDLPEYDREVVVFTQHYPLEGSEYAVYFAHRPNPNGWDGKSLSTGKVEHYTPKTYDKGGWNIPDIVYWLDVELPKETEEL